MKESKHFSFYFLHFAFLNLDQFWADNNKITVMHETVESGQDLQLTGNSGSVYNGKIYSDKQGNTSLNQKAIACLSNSHWDGHTWHHQIRDIYDVESPQAALDHFRERDDMSHIILITKDAADTGPYDKIDDLRRSYIHR